MGGVGDVGCLLMARFAVEKFRGPEKGNTTRMD